MRRILIFMFAIFAATYSIQSLSTGMELRIRAQADAMLGAFARHDVEEYVDRIYPRIVEMSGGREALIRQFQSFFDSFEKEQIQIVSYEVYSISDPVKAGEELHAVVQYSMSMTTPKGVVSSKSFYVASSNDKGRQWTFVEGAQLTNASVNKIFPSFNAKLKLPTSNDTVLMATGGQYIDVDDYLNLSLENQEIYAAGMADAFVFISKKTGYMDGLGDCFSERKVDASAVAGSIRMMINSWSKHQQGKFVEVARLYEAVIGESCKKFL